MPSGLKRQDIAEMVGVRRTQMEAASYVQARATKCFQKTEDIITP
jgi:hypothetical protein